MSEERAKHIELAGVVKSVHKHLRNEYKCRNEDWEQIWQEHTEKTDVLEEYATAMHGLATQHWRKNDQCRIDWCHKICLEYFHGGLLKSVLEKEERKLKKNKSNKNNSVRQDTGLVFNSKSEPDSDFGNSGTASTRTASSNSRSPDAEIISEHSDWSFIERDDLPDGCPTKRDGCPDGSTNQREGCPDGSVNERPVPDGSLNYRDGLAQRPVHSVKLPSKRKCVELPFTGPIYLLDVGSCYNPFQHYEDFCVTALDLHPATQSVLQCDFLRCRVTDNLADLGHLATPQTGSDVRVVSGCHRDDAIGCHSDKNCDFHPPMLTSPVTVLPSTSFDVVVFSLLLEYLPCCEQRYLCCQKAWRLLRNDGLLLVITPDSHREHRNAAMIKSWKLCLASIGFQRVSYVKQEHIHCMAFRRLSAGVPDQPDQASMLYIPQDFHEEDEEVVEGGVEYDAEELANDFAQLPDFDPS